MQAGKDIQVRDGASDSGIGQGHRQGEGGITDLRGDVRLFSQAGQGPCDIHGERHPDLVGNHALNRSRAPELDFVSESESDTLVFTNEAAAPEHECSKGHTSEPAQTAGFLSACSHHK